jgi:uncharacterized membrane protein YeaQ/YmgE (transglycosylase-associated protein family)
MYLLVWTIVGGFIGWLASVITNNERRMGLVLNVMVGLIGSFLGGLIANFFQIAPLNIFTFWGMAFSLLGATLFLMFVNFMRPERI